MTWRRRRPRTRDVLAVTLGVVMAACPIERPHVATVPRQGRVISHRLLDETPTLALAGSLSVPGAQEGPSDLGPTGLGAAEAYDPVGAIGLCLFVTITFLGCPVIFDSQLVVAAATTTISDLLVGAKALKCLSVHFGAVVVLFSAFVGRPQPVSLAQMCHSNGDQRKGEPCQHPMAYVHCLR